MNVFPIITNVRTYLFCSYGKCSVLFLFYALVFSYLLLFWCLFFYFLIFKVASIMSFSKSLKMVTTSHFIFHDFNDSELLCRVHIYSTLLLTQILLCGTYSIGRFYYFYGHFHCFGLNLLFSSLR